MTCYVGVNTWQIYCEFQIWVCWAQIPTGTCRRILQLTGIIFNKTQTMQHYEVLTKVLLNSCFQWNVSDTHLQTNMDT